MEFWLDLVRASYELTWTTLFGAVSCPWWWFFFLSSTILVVLFFRSSDFFKSVSTCRLFYCRFLLYLSNAGTTPTSPSGTTPTMTPPGMPTMTPPGTPSSTSPGMTPSVFNNGISPSGSGGFNDGSGSGGVGFSDNRNSFLAVGSTLWLAVVFLWGWWKWRIGWWISMNGWDFATYRSGKGGSYFWPLAVEGRI